MVRWIKKDGDAKEIIYNRCEKEEAESIYKIRKKLPEYLRIIGYCEDEQGYCLAQEKKGKPLEEQEEYNEHIGENIIKNISSLHSKGYLSNIESIKDIYNYRNRIYFSAAHKLRESNNSLLFIDELIRMMKILKIYNISQDVELEYYLINYIDENIYICKSWHMRRYYKQAEPIKILEKIKKEIGIE